MKAQLVTCNSAGTAGRLAWLPMPPLTELRTEIPFSYRRTQQTLAGGQYNPLFLYGFVTYFCMAHETGTVFTLLNGWNKTKRRTIFGDMRKLHEIHISGPTNQVLLGYSHSHLFVYCPWLCSRCNFRVQWIHRCDRGQMTLKAWNIYSLVLSRKSSSTFSLFGKKKNTVIPPSEDSLWGLNTAASGKESTCQCRRHRRRGFDPWVGKIPWRKKCNMPQYSCLENSTSRGTWQATVHGVSKSQTRLSHSMHTEIKSRTVLGTYRCLRNEFLFSQAWRLTSSHSLKQWLRLTKHQT